MPLLQTVRSEGFTQPLGTREHGMREFEILDLNGFRLRFGQYL
jgi:ParB-like chromosome segregation protein Spo0J